MKNRVCRTLTRGRTVTDDWRAWLPKEKDEVFRGHVRLLEISYNMLSVSLDEALELRQDGHLEKASQALRVAPDLCSRFSHTLAALLGSLGEHAKHHGTIPNAAPLDPANFQGTRGQRAARFTSLLCRVLFSERSQFLYKINTLGDMVEDLTQDFCAPASEIASEPGMQFDAEWRALDEAHYDLNTCLRESIVVLKSFLMALPDEELGLFQLSVAARLRVARPKRPSLSQRLIRHRRMTPLGGE